MKMGAQRVRSYSLLAKYMHWAFIGIFAYAVINQVDEVEELVSSLSWSSTKSIRSLPQ